ncbi:MAG: adenosylcobinamide amidohydrolase [Anaerofustis sp.]
MKQELYRIRFGTDDVTAYLDTDTNSILLPLDRQADVLSTAIVNGGLRRDLALVFNHTCSPQECYMLADTYEAHMRELMRRNGFDPSDSVGMTTAANVSHCAFAECTYESLSVTALVTAGIDHNGGRAGDPCPIYDPAGNPAHPKPGTINIILVINAALSAGTMERALVMCTEAKTAALQELMAGSCFSHGIATGSGTDQTVLVANPDSELYFEHAGKHSKLGELIGRSVIQAVKEALNLETGLNAERQFRVLSRLKRYGVSEESMMRSYRSKSGSSESDTRLKKAVDEVDQSDRLVCYTSMFVHLLDQAEWGILPFQCASDIAAELMEQICGKTYARVGQSLSQEDLLETWQCALMSTVFIKNTDQT